MLTITRLTVNHLTEAVGLHEPPRFSWAMASDRRGAAQTARRLQIAADRDFAHVLWDSGDVASDVSQNVAAEEFAPAPSTEYFARVRAVCGGETSDWSSPVRLVTGLMGGWRAKYVTAEVPPCPEASRGTRVRGAFVVIGAVRSAWLYASALGLYVPFMNGARVGEDCLAPGWTSYDSRALYQTYDVAPLLRQGENVLGATLGAGWYKGLMGFMGMRCNYGDRTAFLAQLVIDYHDGRRQVVTTDGSWRGGDSPVTFAEIYDGERYDARLETPGWCEPGFDDAGWRPVAVVDKAPALVAQPGCRIRRETVLPAVRLLVTPRGERVVDFGQNLTGWPEFTLRGRAGETYVLKCFETLDADGNVYTANLRLAKQELHYTCRDDGPVRFHPEFTFCGFRYAQLLRWPEDAVAEDFCAWVVHSDFRPTGEFECGEPLVNQLVRNIRWSLKDNFLDVPTDCPQRNERLGWTGDAQIFCRAATLLEDVYPFYRKWLADVRADMTPEGGVPHVVPDIITRYEGRIDDWLVKQGTHSAAGWADSIVICPWTLYLAYGDPAILEENYDAMTRWIGFMTDHAEGCVWRYRLQFGDWVALDAEEGSYYGATPTDLTSAAYYIRSTRVVAAAARALGREDDARRYGALAAALTDDFQRRFFDGEGNMTARTQTAHILALSFDLAPERWRQKTVDELVRLLDERDGHLVTGFMGTPCFTQALADNGRVREAYDLLLKRDFPSWLYQVEQGATTVWEHWDGIRPDGTMWSPDMNSFNHYAYGSIGEWLFRGVAGVNADPSAPGYRHALLRPRPDRRLGFARGVVETPYGTLASAWAYEGDDLRLSLTVPANTTASLSLDNIAEILDADGAPLSLDADTLRGELGAGRYEIRVGVRQ